MEDQLLQLYLLCILEANGPSKDKKGKPRKRDEQGHCCDLGWFSRAYLQSKQLSRPMLQKVRSGLVLVFQWSEWKLAMSFSYKGGLYC